MSEKKKLYKLTEKDGQTYGGTQWGEGIKHTAPGTGVLCKEGWLHAYEHPLLAVLLNPIHACFKKPRLWEAEGTVGISDSLKVGCTELITVKEIPLPEISREQKVYFAILCAQKVYSEGKWLKWAENWLKREDRSAHAAADAAAYAAHAAHAADNKINFASLAEKACSS